MTDDNFISPENLEAGMEMQVRVEREFAKIDLAAQKLSEKYKEYADLQSFVSYLQGLEKMFTQAKIEKMGSSRLKEELVRNEIHFFADDSGLDEKVFATIRDDFGLAMFTIEQIEETCEKLLAKYPDCADCHDFILYLKKISLLFLEAQRERWDVQVIKENLWQARMEKLSADGQPELKILEKIRQEFEMLLGEK